MTFYSLYTKITRVAGAFYNGLACIHKFFKICRFVMVRRTVLFLLGAKRSSVRYLVPNLKRRLKRAGSQTKIAFENTALSKAPYQNAQHVSTEKRSVTQEAKALDTALSIFFLICLQQKALKRLLFLQTDACIKDLIKQCVVLTQKIWCRDQSDLKFVHKNIGFVKTINELVSKVSAARVQAVNSKKHQITGLYIVSTVLVLLKPNVVGRLA